VSTVYQPGLIEAHKKLISLTARCCSPVFFNCSQIIQGFVRFDAGSGHQSDVWIVGRPLDFIGSVECLEVGKRQELARTSRLLNQTFSNRIISGRVSWKQQNDKKSMWGCKRIKIS